MSNTIELLTSKDEKKWDDFVESHPLTRFSFLTNYKSVIEATFGYSPRYFIFKKNGVIKGIFPSFLVNGNLISLPFCVYGGILVQDLNIKEISLIFKKIKSEYKSITIRGLEQKINCLFSNYLYPCGLLSLDSEENLRKNKINRSIKKNINRAKKFNLKIFKDNSTVSIKNIFYPLYLKEMKKFGSPPHSLIFFLNFIKYFKKKVHILYVKNMENVVISSLFGIGCGDNFYIAYNPSISRFYFQRPNDFIHWEMIRWAYKKGYKYFDFGPMRYEGQANFKKKWGVEQIKYFIYSSREESISNVNKFGFLSSFWKIFMPISLSKKIGPIIRKKFAI